MKKTIKDVQVDRLHESHPRIRAEDWISPLIRRLLRSQKYADGSCLFQDSHKPARGQATEGKMNLKWVGMKADFGKCLKTYQEPRVTEYASLGLACILTKERADMEITDVTRIGDRADYWLGDREMLLEVSGQQQGNLDALHKEKVTQLRENPFEKDGYVCVANYDDRKAIFWHHRYETNGDI